MNEGNLVLGTHAGYSRFLSAQRASLVFLNVEHAKICVKGVVDQQTTLQRVSYTKYELEDLRGLDQANLPGHNAQDAHFTSGGHQPIPRGSRPYAAHTGAAARRMKYARLALESRRSSVDIGFCREEARIVEQVFCGEIV